MACPIAKRRGKYDEARAVASPQELRRRRLSGAGVHRGSHGRVISRSGLCLDGVMFVRVVPHNVTSTWKLNRKKMSPTVRRTFLQSAPHQSKQSTSVMQRQPRSKIYIVTFVTTPTLHSVIRVRAVQRNVVYGHPSGKTSAPAFNRKTGETIHWSVTICGMLLLNWSLSTGGKH